MENKSLAISGVKQRKKLCYFLSIFQGLVLVSLGPQPSHMFFPLVSGRSPIFLASVYPSAWFVCSQKRASEEVPPSEGRAQSRLWGHAGLGACPPPGLTSAWPISEPEPLAASERIFSMPCLCQKHAELEDRHHGRRREPLAEVGAKPEMAVGCLSPWLSSNSNLLRIPRSIHEFCPGVRDKEASPSPDHGQAVIPGQPRLQRRWLEHNPPATKPEGKIGG